MKNKVADIRSISSRIVIKYEPKVDINSPWRVYGKNGTYLGSSETEAGAIDLKDVFEQTRKELLERKKWFDRKKGK